MMLPPARPCMPMGQLPGGGLPLPGAMQMPTPPGMPMPSLGMPNLGTTVPPGPGPCGMPMPRPMTMAPPCGGTLPAPRPMMPTMPTMDASMPRPPMGSVIPPPQPGTMRPQMIPAPQQPFNPSLPSRPPGPSLPQQLAQLQAAGQEGQRQAPPPPAFHGDKKPQLFMLIAQLAPHVQESHMQQLLEQCGDLQAFRRAQDAEGKAMSFGVAQFADPESAWKAVSCLAKRRIGGQEIKVLLEENTEAFILKWKMSQKVVFRVNTDEDLEWELERKTVSCNALLDGKLEELFGVEGTGAVKQRRQELREREEKRVERAKKRKAWREGEFAAELDRLEASEMALREAEKLRDAEDREKEDFELSEKQRKEMKLEKLEAHHGIVRSVHVAQLADNQALMDLVHKVQEEPREELFTIKLDTAYLRNERILERKLRPWLERKVDLHMGGQSSDLVELILRRVNGAAQPDPLIAELERFLDDFAEPLVERLWRMLTLEMIQNGLVLPTVAKRQKKEEIKNEKL